MPRLLELSTRTHIVRNAFKVSLFVGTILNLINQAEGVLAGGTVSWPHLLLNYLVPYCVATYSAAKNEMSRLSQDAHRSP